MGVLRGTPRNVSTDIHRGTVGEGGSCGKVMLFTGVCHSVLGGGLGIPGTMSLWGEKGMSSGDRYVQSKSPTTDT